MSAVEDAVQSLFVEFNKQQPWNHDRDATGIAPTKLVLGVAPGSVFEVVTATAGSRPNKSAVIEVWKARHGSRAVGTVLIVGYEHHGTPYAAVAGPDPDSPVSHHELSIVERVLERALDAGTLKEARDIVAELPVDADGETHYGLANEGLFAWHSLTVSVPARPDWAAAAAAAKTVRGARGDMLLTALGWQISQHGDVTMLRDGTKDRAIAVLLTSDEMFDRPSLKYGLGVSPVEHSIQVARKEEVDWVIAVQGPRVRLYAAKTDEGVSRAGVATFAELNVDLLTDDAIAYVHLLLTPSALRKDGTVHEILADSRDHATALGARLRDRIYKDVVGGLATVVANRLGDTSEKGLRQAYHVTLVVLFRLLFVAYAEDRHLLPYRSSNAGLSTEYGNKALKTRAVQYAETLKAGGQPDFDTKATTVWDDLRQIWTAVHDGHADWHIPAYGGNLFRLDTETGRQIEALALTNAEFGPLLAKLLVDEDKHGTQGPVDFRSLSVREFGTIYEGLLESSLSVAATDLSIDKSDAYVPAKSGADVEVAAGEIYFHNASGARKATGSYFTKSFAVEHLLKSALDPTLDEHLARIRALLDENKPGDAADAFFDFRVADIAMGSGHFLVGAVTHIADKMEAFLVDYPVAGVTSELERLRLSAKQSLAQVGFADDAPEADIRNSDLILRQVAKRCIYGVDINEIAVDLARLALWIHTFVPGLPMSALDHGLVSGNSLTGIATIDELLAVMQPGTSSDHGVQQSFVYDEIVEALAAADEPLARAARLAETSVDETREAERLHAEAEWAVAPVRLAMDAAIAARAGVGPDLSVTAVLGWDAVVEQGKLAEVRGEIEQLNPVHFPVAFPEVFRASRERAGFDVVVGNPPWDEVMVEEPKFWQRYEAGVMGLPPARQKKRIAELRVERADLLPLLAEEQAHATKVRRTLLAGPYPGLGTGDVDYYQAFAWRYVTVVRTNGRLGAVFPRSLLNSAGTALWREHVLSSFTFELVVSLVNTRHWIFDEPHPQYSITLLTLRSGHPSDVVHLAGPLHSYGEFEKGSTTTRSLPVATLLSWGNGAAFPVLPSADAIAVFNQMRRHPRFDANPIGDFRPVAEFHATNDRKTFDAGERSPDRWPVLTGASFSHWDPDFGEPYAWADPAAVTAVLYDKRRRQARTSSSAFYGLPARVVDDPQTLPCLRPRIAFRDVTNQTNARTLLCALVPPQVVLTNKAPYLLMRGGRAEHEAAVLGVLSSLPLDWYARRFVELSVSLHILNAFPLPTYAPSDQLWQRLVTISGTLAAIDDRYADWANEVGVALGGLEGESKDDPIAELDALVAHLYGLTRDQMEIIFSTFHRGWDFSPRLARALVHYDAWESRAAHHHGQLDDEPANIGVAGRTPIDVQEADQ